MNVPTTCDDWRNAMAQGNDESHVLDNIERDPCVPGDAEDNFFRRLEVTAPWPDAADAWEKATTVVRNNPTQFCCTGDPVPKSIMKKLIRFRLATEWDRLIQDMEPKRAQALNTKYPIPSNDPNWPAGLTAVQRDALCTELGVDYPTGHLNGITWVADEGAVQPSAASDMRETLRCLGLPHFEGHAWVLVMCYNRSDTANELHVPRALDAIDFSPFDVQTDCKAPHGNTQPTANANRGATGFPEAVHRSDRLTMQKMEIMPADGHTP